jgi:hypothetical protein
MKLDPDLSALLDALLEVTRKLLKKQGAFLPHGAFITAEGKVSLLGAKTPEVRPGAQKILKLLEHAAKAMADNGQCKAVGIAIDIWLKQAPNEEDVGKDAVWAFLEHGDGTCANVYMPYSKDRFNGYTYGTWFANYAEPKFFLKK